MQHAIERSASFARTRCLDAATITHVRQSFDKMAPLQDLFARVFYARLFELNPNIAIVLRGNIRDQEARFASMIATVIDRLDRPDEIGPMLKNLGRRHVEDYGVRADDFDLYGIALVSTVAKFLGDGFTPPVAAAWDTFYAYMTDTMLGR